MEPEDAVDPSASDSGFSSFLQALAAAPPPDRAFAPGAIVQQRFRVSRPLFESGATEVHLAVGESGDVALVRRPGGDTEGHGQLLAAWADDDLEGRVRVTWSGAVEGDVVLACTPVPVGTLRAWLEAAPHPWAEVVARLGPVARALARAHASGVQGFTLDADHLWLGLDGRVRLPPPEPSTSPREAKERAGLAALVRAVVDPSISLPVPLRPEAVREVSTKAMAVALTRGPRRLWPWLLAAGVLVSASVVGVLFVATAPQSSTVTPAASVRPDAPSHRELWTRAAMRVDAGDARAAALVDALVDAGMPAHAALLRSRLADDAATWEREVREASALHVDDLGVAAEIALERADLALHRGALLEARWWLAEATRLHDATPDAPTATLQRVRWSVLAQGREVGLGLGEIRSARDRASSPSLRRTEHLALEAEVLAATGSQGFALELHQVVLGEPRADLARLRLEHRVARAHLLAQAGRPTDALRLLDGLERDASTPRERAAVGLGRAAAARVQGDATAAAKAIDRAADALDDREDVGVALDLAFERATWLLHAGAFDAARAQLAAALDQHDALRGLDARSRVPLERAYRRALDEDATLMSSAPPSRASASP